MAAVVIRNIPEATHKALKARAKAHGRSTEAEIRDILEKALGPAQGAATGKEIFDALHAFGQKYGGIELDITRDKTPPPDIEFE
jgi:plasmid stability protein